MFIYRKRNIDAVNSTGKDDRTPPSKSLRSDLKDMGDGKMQSMSPDSSAGNHRLSNSE